MEPWSSTGRAPLTRNEQHDRSRVSERYRPRPRESGRMSPKGSVSRYRLPCLRTWTLPRSVAFSIGTTRGSTNATPPSAAFAFVARGRVSRGRVGRDASAGFAIVTSGDLGKTIGLVGHDQRIDQ